MSTATPGVPGRAPDSATSMGLEEARQIPWLSSRPKPLGELLDEGYLDTSRLEWAAEKAYNPRLKEAARVLLDWHVGRSKAGDGPGKSPVTPSISKQPIRVGISLEDARSTPWPFGTLKGQPMGMLSETRRVSLKDLAYLVENAWEDRVRRAAGALIAIRLDQDLEEPPPPAGMIRVVAGKRSFAEGRQLSLAFLEGVIGGALFAISAGYFVITLLQRRTPAHPRITLDQVFSSPESIVAFAIVLTIVAGVLFVAFLAPHLVFNRIDRRIEAYRRGEEGEEKIVEKARRALDGTWSLFRNVVLPGRRRADLDIVLVGPPGVWTLEVKALVGKYKNVGDAWGYRAGNRWKRMRKNPTRQARNGAIALAEFLRADGIKTYVSAAVAWANEDGHISVEDPIVPVWTIDRLEDELGNLGNGQRLEVTAQERIVEKLTRLLRAPKKGAW
jgi:hypothetical protein